VRPGFAPSRLFYVIVGALTVLAATPFWLTHILPMQDYPHTLGLARAYIDYKDPASPFFGTYTTGFPLSPLVLLFIVLRAIASFTDLETAGRVVWTLYAVALPASSLYLLRVLGRDRWGVLLVYPFVISYWVIGGFFAFATGAPLLVVGLAFGVRWFEAPTWKRGTAVALVACALHLWHALLFAQLMFDLSCLWALFRFDDLRARVRALAPLVSPLLLFVAWMLATVHGRPPGRRTAVWPNFLDNAGRFFEYIGPIVPGAAGAVALVALLLAAGALSRRTPAVTGSFRVRNPFGWLALLAALSFLCFPMTCFGVEGIANRQPWLAALLLVFAWNPPMRATARAVLLSILSGAGALMLGRMCSRFTDFDRETSGASRLIDRLGPHETLLAPIGSGSTASFPGKPLIALELYASVRHGGLPNQSFAGYDIMLIRYVKDNPMPGLGPGWIDNPALQQFDYVLLRESAATAGARKDVLRLVAKDGPWSLFAVCGSQAMLVCD
jgi:hypothetical protein